MKLCSGIQEINILLPVDQHLFYYIIFLLPLAAASAKISSDVDFFVSLAMSLKIKHEFSFYGEFDSSLVTYSGKL